MFYCMFYFTCDRSFVVVVIQNKSRDFTVDCVLCVAVCRAATAAVGAAPNVTPSGAWVGRGVYRPSPYTTTRLTPVAMARRHFYVSNKY